MGPSGLGEIDGLLLPPGKAYELLTGHLITGKPLTRSENAEEMWFKSNHPQAFLVDFGGYVFFKKHISGVVTYWR